MEVPTAGDEFPGACPPLPASRSLSRIMPIVLPLLWLVAAVAVAAAIFGAATWRLARTRRVVLLLAWWIVMVGALGVLGGLRLVFVFREIAVDAPERGAFATAVVFAEFFAIALLPPLIALIVKGRRKPDARVGSVVLSAVGWSLVGFILASALQLAMDLFGVPFMQIPGRR